MGRGTWSRKRGYWSKQDAVLSVVSGRNLEHGNIKLGKWNMEVDGTWWETAHGTWREMEHGT